MGLVIDFAAPHTPAARDAERNRRRSAPRRRVGLLSVVALRRASFASSSPGARTAFAGDEALTYPERMAALGRVRVAVLADFAHRGLVLPDPVACDTPT